MSGIGKLGLVLVVLGVLGLLIGHFSYTDTKPVIKAGPIQVDSKEHHSVWIPEAASGLVLAAGVVLLSAGRRGQ